MHGSRHLQVRRDAFLRHDELHEDLALDAFPSSLARVPDTVLQRFQPADKARHLIRHLNHRSSRTVISRLRFGWTRVHCLLVRCLLILKSKPKRECQPRPYDRSIFPSRRKFIV